MKKVFSIILLATTTGIMAQPSIEWQTSFGGSLSDRAQSIEQIAGGEFVFAGQTRSVDGDVSTNHGGGDCWVGGSANFGLGWEKTYGGTGTDRAYSIHKTPDGGYVFAGHTNSSDGDLTANYGGFDIWVVKITANGTITWQKNLGGSGNDFTNSMTLSSDGGYVVVGASSSNDVDISGNHGGEDFVVIKLNSTGGIEWSKSLGGTGNEEAASVSSTADGGYIVAGVTDSNDGDVSGNHGDADVWVVKLNATGTIVWQKSLGGSLGESARDIKQTADGGYIFTGYTDSDDGDVIGQHSVSFDDQWVVKLSATGEIEWQKCLGDVEDDSGYSVIQTADGGYAVAGSLTNASGFNDFLVTKLTATGEQSWQLPIGGNDDSAPTEIEQTPNGGFILAGFSNSTGGDIATFQGADDAVIVGLSAVSSGIEDVGSLVDVQLFPNPSTNSVHVQLKQTGQTKMYWNIYDAVGKKVRSGSDQFSGIWNRTISLKNMESGIYSITFEMGNVHVSRKLIVK